MVFYCFVPPPLEGLPSLPPCIFLVLYWDCNLQIEPSQNKESVMLPLRILLSPWRARRPTTGRGISRLSSFFLTAVALLTMFSLGVSAARGAPASQAGDPPPPPWLDQRGGKETQTIGDWSWASLTVDSQSEF